MYVPSISLNILIQYKFEYHTWWSPGPAGPAGGRYWLGGDGGGNGLDGITYRIMIEMYNVTKKK